MPSPEGATAESTTEKGDPMETEPTETEEALPATGAPDEGAPSKDDTTEDATKVAEAPAVAKDDEEMTDLSKPNDHPPVAAAAAAAATDKEALETQDTAADTAAEVPPVEKAAATPTETTATTTTTPPPNVAAPISKPALVNLNEWDKKWEEQYERRKRRKVVPGTLPAHTIGRADDPIRLAAGPCTCSGPCHLNDLCPCNHAGLFCTETCRCGKKCENSVAYAESRHRALVQAIQQGHRPIVHECCPCAPACEAVTCPCAMLGQRCRHTAPFRACKNPCGAELARPLGNKKQQGPLAICLRVTPPKKKPTASKVPEKKPASASGTWEIADARADEYFANNQGAHDLDALYDVAANAQVHARSELQLNQAERWWWRDIIPSVASPGRKKVNHGEDLECHEAYEGIQVERDVNKPRIREAIIQVSQETLILRYAAMVLRQKARDLAAQRLKRKKSRGS
eukprot:scaffold1120_cov142-Amphora_coffeaeformis.AAC.1